MGKKASPSVTKREKRVQIRLSGPLLRVFEARAAFGPLSTYIRAVLVDHAKQRPADLEVKGARSSWRRNVAFINAVRSP